MIRIFKSKSDSCNRFLKKLLSREILGNTEELKVVKAIINDVKLNKDKAVFKYTKKFDGAHITADTLQVKKEEIKKAVNSADDKILSIIKKAADNIRKFHSLQITEDIQMSNENGYISLRSIPIDKAGVYVPGGRAAYPSSVLMNVIPAKVAGVKEIIMCTPPDENGEIYNLTLAAAYIAGVDKIYKAGGAQAIAAMAYGTDIIPKVSKITGPGNIYVTLAKKEVFGKVGIDMLAGPSEILIIADKYANPKYLAADLLSQAEHDPLASSILLCDDENLSNKVALKIEIILNNLPTNVIARQSIKKMGAIILVDDIDEAVNISNEIAPEHLEISIKKPRKILDKIRNAGAVFLGEYSPEPLGDYFAGSNHVLPTSGAAKFASPLGVYDFIKRQSIIDYNYEGLKKVSDDIIDFAKKEGLYAHAKAISVRFEEEI